MALPQVLVADSDSGCVAAVAAVLGDLGCINPLVHVSTAEAGRRWAEGSPGARLAVAIVDLDLPAGEGLALIEWLRSHESCPGAAIVAVTGSADVDQLDGAYRLGVRRFLAKPFRLEAVADAIAELGRPWAWTAV